MYTRTLGRSGIEVSAMGMGCWAIGGPFWSNGIPSGWGPVDDAESTRAIHRALDLGITFFDTAAVYGCGHSERVLGAALAGRRDRVVISTKFGKVFDERTRRATGSDISPGRIREECEASLRRLGTDYLDLYLLHEKNAEAERAMVVRDTLEQLVADGKIRFYGWSTDDPRNARLFAQGAHCTVIEQIFNVFEGDARTLAVCEQSDLASINRSPLSMGLLTGKFTAETPIPADDVRSARPALQGERRKRLAALEAIRAVLTADGRTSAQGALAWLWARSPVMIPIPGCRSVAQVEENFGALHRGPLPGTRMQEIAARLRESGIG